jgi:hypothetical protein
LTESLLKKRIPATTFVPSCEIATELQSSPGNGHRVQGIFGIVIMSAALSADAVLCGMRTPSFKKIP